MTKGFHSITTMLKTASRASGWFVGATVARRHLRSFLLLTGVLWFAAVCQAAAGEEALEPSKLRAAVSDYVRQYPEATLAEVANAANAMLPHHGLNFEFFWTGDDTFDDEASRKLTLIGPGRTFVETVPDLVDKGPCGEYWFTVPALRAGEDWIDLAHRGETVRVERPEILRLELVKIFGADGLTALRTLELPWAADPVGVRADASAVLIEFLLDDDLAPWWRRVRAVHGNIVRSHPILLIEVVANGLSFVADPASYGGETVEDIPDFPEKRKVSYLQRLRFSDSGLIVEYLAPCS